MNNLFDATQAFLKGKLQVSFQKEALQYTVSSGIHSLTGESHNVKASASTIFVKVKAGKTRNFNLLTLDRNTRVFEEVRVLSEGETRSDYVMAGWRSFTLASLGEGVKNITEIKGYSPKTKKWETFNLLKFNRIFPTLPDNPEIVEAFVQKMRELAVITENLKVLEKAAKIAKKEMDPEKQYKVSDDSVVCFTVGTKSILVDENGEETKKVSTTVPCHNIEFSLVEKVEPDVVPAETPEEVFFQYKKMRGESRILYSILCPYLLGFAEDLLNERGYTIETLNKATFDILGNTVKIKMSSLYKYEYAPWIPKLIKCGQLQFKEVATSGTWKVKKEGAEEVEDEEIEV